MNQLRRWLCISCEEANQDVPYCSKVRKKPYPAHERCVRLHVACIMCLCAQVWEEEHKFTPLINNKPACVGGLCGWFSLHIVSLVVLAQIFPCLTFDALLFFG